MCEVCFAQVIECHTFNMSSSPLSRAAWMHCLECHQLSMVLHRCTVQNKDISSTIMEFLRPSVVFSVVSDLDAFGMACSRVTCMDIDRKACLYEIPIRNSVHITDAIHIQGRSSIICVLENVDSLGLFDMQTHDWQAIFAIGIPCRPGRLAHVPCDGLVAFGSSSSLSVFEDDTLCLFGSINIPTYITAVVGEFTHDSWASCIAVGGQQGGVYVVHAKQQTIIKTINTSPLAFLSRSDLENFAVAPCGFQVACTRGDMLYVIDLNLTDDLHAIFASSRQAISCVNFVTNTLLVYARHTDLCMVDTRYGVLVSHFCFHPCSLPRRSTKLFNHSCMLVACIGRGASEMENFVYKIQLAVQPFLSGRICEDVVDQVAVEPFLIDQISQDVVAAMFFA